MASSVPTPRATRVTETSISLAWPQPASLPSAQLLQVRSVPDAWGAASGREVSLQPSATSAEVGGLNPTASYEFRLLHADAAGARALGAGYAVDTLPAGCGDSGKKQSSCELQ